jgi:tetrahydromethanopterin S-methyltransferase subunit B
MNDIFDMIADLKELQKLYVMGDICYIDFQEKIAKYDAIIEDFERAMGAQEEMFDNVPV